MAKVFLKHYASVIIGAMACQSALASEPDRLAGEYLCRMNDASFNAAVAYHTEPTVYMPAHAIGWIFNYINEGETYLSISSRLDAQYMERERTILIINRRTLAASGKRWVIEPQTGETSIHEASGTCTFRTK
ncbi:MAG: hypothetical protein AAF683_00415 [Pseudomonadota bacterium]